MVDLPTGGDWDGEAVNHAIDNLPDADEMLDRMLKACASPNAVARVRFGDGEWEEIEGPILLERVAPGHERCITFDIDSVVVRQPLP